ncbi:choline ABC transporter permease subunit [Aestuariivirga litoralis]|uniref:choline ABC transporter permease subunit n=1 Tax=Aestuariivirga litoralis TaxID=2650924 RepID=UPI0018C5EFA1|nr:choline ABC transporter permease subunit [Aestuariivirga litoralis]MBG1232875.1 choline ABC transporter permease subunit [Aestuariivirga litoralis]
MWDPISTFIASWKIPVGQWGKMVIEFITTYFDWLFTGLKVSLNWLVEGTTWTLLQCPPVLLAIALAAGAYLLQRRKWLTLAVLLGLLFIINQGLWKETVQTLVLVLYAAALSMALGVPLGIWAAHKPRVWQTMQPIMDLMQTMPTFVYLIPILILFGLGAAPALIVTIIFAMPAPVRMTYLGLTSVPKSILEAGESFGATKRQLLWKVELPAALPTIMAGLTQCIMLSLSMVVIATLIGAPSLGNPVNRALNNRNIPLGIEAGLAIVALAIILDRVLAVRVGAKK